MYTKRKSFSMDNKITFTVIAVTLAVFLVLTLVSIWFASFDIDPRIFASLVAVMVVGVVYAFVSGMMGKKDVES